MANDRFSGRQTAAPAGGKRLVGQRELSAITCLSERTLFTLRAMGLPHIKLANKILSDPEEVIEWLKTRHGVGTVSGGGGANG